MPYQVPVWFKKAITTRDLTVAFIKKAETDASRIIAQNKADYEKSVKLHSGMVETAELIYGKTSVVPKYLKAHKPPAPPNIASVLERLKKRARIKERNDAEAAKEQAAQAQRRERNRLHARRYAQAKREFEDACVLEGTTVGEVIAEINQL